jgi:ketosteroid isomerase-like protein
MTLVILLVSVSARVLDSSPKVDVRAEEEALLQADRDFNLDTARRGGDGWADAFMKDGIMFPDAGRVEGRETIREMMKPVLSGDTQLRWEPVTAVVGSGGDLGYTLGKWKQIMVLGDGRDSTLSTGNYVSIWRKLPGEGWRVAVDIGNKDP